MLTSRKGFSIGVNISDQLRNQGSNNHYPDVGFSRIVSNIYRYLADLGE